MKLEDVNVDNIKVVIFDFDGTLAIHKDKDFDMHRGESEEKFISFYEKAYKNPENFYEEVEPCDRSEVLYDFINILRKKGIKMYCLSGMKFSFHLKAKQAFVNKQYGEDIEVIVASSQEFKLKGIKIIQKITNCNLNEILFVEDLKETINYLKDNGVNVIDINDTE